MEAHTDPTALPDLSPAALLDLLGEWELALRAEDKTPGTIEAYVGGTRRYLDWCRLANTNPMLRASLQTWMTHLLQDGNAPGTVLARKQSVKRYSDWLLATGRIPGQPFLGVRGPAQRRPIVLPLSEDQLRGADCHLHQPSAPPR